jgi:mannose-6-phosphate isomerase-like protein (cupin superfamily)
MEESGSPASSLEGVPMTTPSPRPRYEIAHVDDIPATPYDGSHGFEIPGEWKQLRHYFSIREFSANAMVATETGQQVVHEHSERANDDPTKPGDEELYIVLRGRFRVRLDDESVEVGAGTIVFVGEPSTVRSFTALEPHACVVAVGTNPGVEFAVSSFEREVSPPPRWR